MTKAVVLSIIKLNIGLIIRNWTLSIFIYIGFIYMVLCAIGLLKFPDLSNQSLLIIMTIMIAIILSGIFLKNKRIMGTIEFSPDNIIISHNNKTNTIKTDDIKLMNINYKGHKNSNQIPYFAKMDGVSKIIITDLSGNTYKYNFLTEHTWQETEFQEIIQKWEFIKIKGKDRFHYKFN